MFHPEKNEEEEIEDQVEKFGNYLDNLPEFKMIPEIKKNPLVVPVLFEYNREHYSSIKVWHGIKNNLGKNVWDYIRKFKKQTDGVGIKKIQEVMNEINRHKLFSKTRIVYMPLELNHNFFIYTILKYKNKKDLLDVIKKISMNSVHINIYPIEDNKIFVIALLGGKSLSNFLTILEEIEVERTLFLQHNKSLPLLTNKKIKKIDYRTMFDPKNLRWEWKL